MTTLQALQVYAAGPAAYSGRITDIQIVQTQGGGTVLYAGSGWGGGIAAWTVLGNGALAPLGSAAYPAPVAPFAKMAMTPAVLGGVPALVGVTSQTDAILVQSLNGNGSFRGPVATTMTGFQAPDDPGAIVAAAGGIFVAQARGGIAAYQAGPGGALVHRGETGGDGPVTGLAAVSVGGQTYVIASHGTAQSVTSHRVLSGGGLVRIDGIGAGDGLGLGMPGPIATAAIGGRSYALVGASLSNSISVLEIGGNGTLTARDHVLDTLGSRFGQITSLQTVTHGGTVFVLAGGGDDGISLMSLLPGGRLIHLHSLADSLGSTLDNVTAIGATAVAGGLAVYVASETEAGLTRVAVDLGGFGQTIIGSNASQHLIGTAGDDIIWGRGGNDTLTGGAGADIFVFDHPGATVRITDFDPARDRLDLSMLPMFHGPTQLGVMGAANGVTLSYNDFSLYLNRAGGGPIDLSEITIDTALSHLPTGNATPPPQSPSPASVLRGSNFADALSGRDGPDLIRGNGGHDTLQGHGGNDTIQAGPGDDLIWGGAGHDSLVGQTGDDTIHGDDGNDTILGVFGDDLIYGGQGDDDINGQTGEDTIYGGPGNDTIWGSYFNDTLFGGSGDDLLDGGARDDEMHGGPGHDEMNGVTGNDRMFGGDGNDTLRGGAGLDRLEGGPGNDLLAGGDHSDTLIGGAGNDTLWGQDGLDRLEGGPGNDLLVGGAHADTFVFAPGGGADTIADFTVDQDILALDSDLWGGGMNRQQVVATFAHAAGGDTVLDFGSGDILLIRGIVNPQTLVSDIVFI